MSGAYPNTRLRRLRAAPWRRRLVRETVLTADDLILPLFVVEGSNVRQPIATLPGIERLSIDLVVATAKEARDLGIPAVALFPVIDAKRKDAQGSEAVNADNLVCRTVRALKTQVPEVGVICDVALDPYTDHGHDGLVDKDGDVVNDATNEVLVRQALTLVEAGTDAVAPSDMMDGRIGAIRAALEQHNHPNALIISYAVKYATAFYGPFRDALGSAGAFKGKDKRTYQMDVANRDEAVREATLDVAEGADMVMVKPALPHLDVIAAVKAAVNVPVLGYQVSGEYAMLKAGAAAGAFDGAAAMYEALVAIKRAGASSIFTYGAIEAAKYLRGGVPA